MSYYLHEKLSYYKVYDQVDTLKAAAKTGNWDTPHSQLYITLDGIITESMIYAERKLGRRTTRKSTSPQH
jgi:hypothetical protein